LANNRTKMAKEVLPTLKPLPLDAAYSRGVFTGVRRIRKTVDGKRHMRRSDIEESKKVSIDLRNLTEKRERLAAAGSPEFIGRNQFSAKKKPVRREELPQAEPRQLVLDSFQIEAVNALRAGYSVLLSAPTGNGKTLVAEILARDLMEAGSGMVYTSPLKALSNQKYRDFKEIFGTDAVGLVTGDISINPDAKLLIMTTEIFRNWCLSEPEQLTKTSFVVFDEIHYLDDAERGTTWEESILFAPAHIKILGLSATVPNIVEIADWISSVRGGKVIVIEERKRCVPLEIHWVTPDGRIVEESEARREVDDLTEYHRTLRGRRQWLKE